MKILRDTCPVCGTPTERARHVFRRDFSAAASIMPFRAYDVCACSVCGLFYAGNIEESMPLADYYAMLSRYEGTSFVLSAPMKRVYEREAAFIAEHIGKDACILDIGCASGGLLGELQRRGYTHLTGLELSGKNCTYIKEHYGIEAYQGGLGRLPEDLGGAFDLIILSGVLEHLLDLQKNVKECLSLLGAQGKLYLFLPDMEQFRTHADLYQEFSAEHINFFSSASLKEFLSTVGMEPLSMARDEEAVCGVAGNLHGIWRHSTSSAGVTVHPNMTETSRRQDEAAMQEYLDVCAELLEHVRMRITAELPRGKAFVWGAATQTALLFQMGILSEENVFGVVDSNANYHGSEAYVGTISSPEILRDHPDVPVLISSQYAQDEIASVIRNTMRLSNRIIKLF